MQKPMSDRSEITAALNAAREAEVRLTISIRHAEKIVCEEAVEAKRIDGYEEHKDYFGDLLSMVAEFNGVVVFDQIVGPPPLESSITAFAYTDEEYKKLDLYTLLIC